MKQALYPKAVYSEKKPITPNNLVFGFEPVFGCDLEEETGFELQ